MKILVYYGKHENIYWLADTDERQVAAFEKLFVILDGLCCYGDSVRPQLLEQARSGNIGAIKQLLYGRRHCEYERWDFIDASDPMQAD